MTYFCEKQHDVSDCAAACLVSIAHYHGYYIRVARARELAETDLNGTNIEGIIRASRKIGLQAEGIRCNKEALFSQISYPCIAHVMVNNQLYHYVVIYKVNQNYIWIGDPARGVMKVKLDSFLGETDTQVNGVKYRWTGILVRFQKSKDFHTNKSTTRTFFWQLFQKEKKIFFQAMLVSALYSILGLSSSIYYKLLIDTILPSHKKTILAMVSAGILLAYALQFGLNLIRARFVLQMGKKLEGHMVTTYMEKLLGLPLRFFEKRKAGDLVNRLRDADNVKEAVSSVAITVVIDGVLACIGLILLARVNPIMFAWALFMIGGYVLLVVLFRNRFDRYNSMWMEYGSVLSSGLIETFNGIETVKAYNMEEKMKHNTSKHVNQFLDCIFHYGQVINLQATMQEFWGLICATVILWIGGINVIDGKMTVGDLILYNSLFVYFSNSIRNIVNMQPKIQTAIVAANRILEIIEMEDGNSTKNELMQSEFCKGDIVFHDVSFGYRMDKETITGVNLRLKQGEKIAVIGENGSGKSTLFKLLLRFYPVSSGDISIGGTPIERFNLKGLRSKIGYVNQETFFFGEKIQDNLKYGSSGVSDEKMIQICKLVKAHEFIESQPFGYDTVLQESGSNLSSGQRQRLALARALLKEPDILILDEFTSNIDSETEQEMKQVLYTYFSEVTIVFITHKIEAFSDCDKVYQMENGKLWEVNRSTFK